MSNYWRYTIQVLEWDGNSLPRSSPVKDIGILFELRLLGLALLCQKFGYEYVIFSCEIEFSILLLLFLYESGNFFILVSLYSLMLIMVTYNTGHYVFETPG